MFQTFYHSFNLKTKLSFILVVSTLVLSLIAGIYFDNFLRKNFVNAAQEKIEYAFAHIQIDLDKAKIDLKKGIAFIQDDEMLLASVELINSYQDKINYDAVLLDEEKKHIADELLSRVKLSQNNDIALYDSHEDLIAYVNKTPKGYYLTYVSYEKGKPVFYSRYEDEYDYLQRPFDPHWLLSYKHISYYTQKDLGQNSIITYHRFNDDLVLKAHKSLFSQKQKHLIAHIEMSRHITQSYLKALSDDMRMSIWSTEKPKSITMLHPLEKGSFELIEEKNHFISSATVKTKNEEIVFYASLHASELEETLLENRITFFVLILSLTLLTLILLRILFKKTVAQPLQSLMKQIENIENQDYSEYKVIRTGDELETISKNVNRLAFTIQEREHSLLKSQKELENLSNTDSLTNLPNRRLFNALLQHGISRVLRTKKHLAVIFLDLDQFKQINDTLGHNIGDILLQEVALRLRKTLRESDTLARIGGDEFNILIEGFDHHSDLEPILSKIIDAFHLSFLCGEHEIRTSASLGISVFPEDGESISDLIKNADLAMYRSKDTGRNRYSFFTKELGHIIENRSKVLHALKNAIEKGDEFTLLYQPKISAQSGKIVAVEALIRWNSHILGWMTPDRFIHLAEETGLIAPIGLWVLQQSSHDFMQLRSQGFFFPYIAVNVSAIQLEKHDFFEMLNTAFEKTEFDPQWLEIEITESYLATNAEHALSTLEKLRTMNIKIAIDDFGTGYSSLSYLKKLPVDRLKIDKSFVDDLPHSSEGVAITRAIIALAKTFNLSITAEGVETKEQLEFLQEAGCDEIQGYYYAKPLTLNELKNFISNH
ncbi:EAL domain-containing protein [Sulfuricurvum sp.]|uniref:putative bifunctional diguanylate cyclase/phosphodiesterase n=1 Tax=Sulfuricurvum sp. TaxID=2025608 RepID=UPI0026030668|nr:EAL domain-containing protein [Sulfuricurvum sp.]MDD2780739.1 EAL domain-containing protein [Sulfuricurvum sp.]